MIDVEKKTVKSIDEYRHNIQLLKYHLKKQKKVNENLKYEAAKFKHRPHSTSDNRHRVYELSDTVRIVSDRLKKMGLVLEDIFRMADSKYEGEITKEQFMKVISRIKTDLNESVFAEMFYAIDTSLNGLISEDQFLNFSIAQGGCSDPKQIRKYQNKIKTKLVSLIVKENGSVAKFLQNLKNPVPISTLSGHLQKLGLDNNQTLVMLKTFDPAHQGFATHQLMLSILGEVKYKNEKQQKVQEWTKTINQLCIIFRDRKLNPIAVYQEADVDGKKGVSSFELEQAFRKLLPEQTSFQIKKWVQLININSDSEITKQEYVNSIRGFYSISQISKFNDQFAKKNPQLAKLGQPSQQSIQKIIKQLSQAIQDRKLKRVDAFKFIDFNNSGDIDKQQLLLGLKSLGIKEGLVMRIMPVFDCSNTDGKIDMDEWLRILGKDAEMSQVGDINLDDSEEDAKKGAKQQKKPIKKEAKKQIKNDENKNMAKKPAKVQQAKPKTPDVKKPSKPVVETKQPQKKTAPKKFAQDVDLNQSAKKSPVKTSTVQKKPETKPIEQPKKPVQQKKDTMNVSTKKAPKKPMPQPEPVVQPEPEEQINIQRYQQQFGIEYKKNKTKFLKNFQSKDKTSKGVLLLKDLYDILSTINPNITQKQKKQLFVNRSNCLFRGKQVKYKQWLEQLSEQYAGQIEQQEQQPQLEKEQEYPSEFEQSSQVIKPQVAKIIEKVAEQDKNKKEDVKRGQKIQEFKILEELIKPQDKKVDQGYKLIKYISDQENQLESIRQKLLAKAKTIRSSKKIYVDKQFPASFQSLAKDKKQLRITNINSLKWKHYNQIFKSPLLFDQQIEPNDIKQGGLGDCYFLSSLAGLAEYRNLIERLFEYYDIENGYFLIWMCIDGVWRLVEIDGYLPVREDGKLAFSYSLNGELWVCLLEKAYAKCYGDYNKIVGGQPFEAVKDLTGSPGAVFNFDHKNQKKLEQNKNKNLYTADEIWQKLVEANKNQFIMTAGTKLQETQSKVQGHDEQVAGSGLVLGHAYSILDCQQVSRERLVKLRNPWGQTEWSGDNWGDKGSKWTDQIKKKLNHQINENDGIFWMPLEAFFSNFLSLTINYINPTYYYRSGQFPKTKTLAITLPTKQFNTGYVTVNHRDHRHDNIPINTEYGGIYSLLGFVESKGKVIHKMQEKVFLYEREGSVLFEDMGKYPEDSTAVVLINLSTEASVTVGFYGDKPADFDSLKKFDHYLEQLAFHDENSPKTQVQPDLLKMWESRVMGTIFLCFKNISKQPITVNSTITEPKNVKAEPPYDLGLNVLKIKPNQTQYVKLRQTARPSSYGQKLNLQY